VDEWEGPATLATPETGTALAGLFREHAPRLTATLTAYLGDFNLAEECVQDAVLAAIEHWPRAGIPNQPTAWLLTAARHKALDRLRRETRYRDKLALLESSGSVTHAHADAEAHLALIFTCCHPALSREAQTALTLRAVMGFTTGQIASAFLTSEAAIAQRIARAKRKIVEAHIPFRIPAISERQERLEPVLTVLFLVFNEGYLSTSGTSAASRSLAEEAAWLAELLSHTLPAEPEVLGLLALMRLHLARAAARFGPTGELVLLRDQDRRRWDQAAIAGAGALIERAAALRRPGLYQLQAAIAACHCEAAAWEATDWPQIVALYDHLLVLSPSPVMRLNRAIARAQYAGPRAALADLNPLAIPLARYHLFHATRAELLRALGRADEARAADREALRLTRNPAEQALLRRRLG
jgi:RNA polymerase sigma-70 factor (ECF subfamily)